MMRFYYFICISFMLVFSNCSSDNDDSDPYNGDDPEAIQKIYEQKFEKTFGSVHETCDWGFDRYEDCINNPRSSLRTFTPPWAYPDQTTNRDAIHQLFQNVTTPNRQTFKWEEFYMYIYKHPVEDDNITVNIKTKDNEWLTFRENGLYQLYWNSGDYDLPIHGPKVFTGCTGDFYLQYSNENGTITTASNYHVTFLPNNGYSKHWGQDLFFIGFDLDGDNNYDDYIIALWEFGYGQCGILVEETSNNPDFDFNDLVFNMALYTKDNATYIEYEIMAVGTTQPVYINNGKEIHSMFDVPLSKKINVGDELEYLPIIYAERFYGELKVKIGDFTYDLNDLLYRKGCVPNVLCLLNGTEYCAYHKANLYSGGGVVYSWMSEGRLISDKYTHMPSYIKGEYYSWY